MRVCAVNLFFCLAWKDAIDQRLRTGEALSISARRKNFSTRLPRREVTYAAFLKQTSHHADNNKG